LAQAKALKEAWPERAPSWPTARKRRLKKAGKDDDSSDIEE